jgi:hypothetical protein
MKDSFAVSGLSEFQKQMKYFAKTIDEIQSPLQNMRYIGIAKELTAMATAIRPSASLTIRAEETGASSENTKKPRVDKTIGIELQSSNATFEEPPQAPIAIDISATMTLLQKMPQDDFVAGEISESERYIEKTAKEYGWPDTMIWLNAVYLDNFSNPAILIGLMHCLSHFKYDDVKPVGPTMALGVLQHSDIFVRDYAIRAFENWGDKEAIPILESLSCEAKWLQEYIDEVIKELKDIV